MDSWTTKAGFPYLNVTRNSDGTVTITQERFLANGQKPAEELVLNYEPFKNPNISNNLILNS